MSGVFHKDIWCLLFRHYFDYPTVVTFRLVSKRSRDFMTDEQRYLVDQISASKLEYRKIARAEIKKVTDTHKATLIHISQSQKGRCTCCGKTIQLRNLSKHQRMCSRVNKIETPRDRCPTCKWELPFCDNSHAFVCPFVITTRCEYCRLNVGMFQHLCPLVPIRCHYCHVDVPYAVTSMHRCNFMCEALVWRGNQHCRGKCNDDSGFCARHLKDRCLARTKSLPSRSCTRAAKDGQKYCGQHLKIIAKNTGTKK